MADNDQKTEQPTDKKLDDARRRGDVPTAPEMRHAVMFLAAMLAVGALGLHMVRALLAMSGALWEQAGDIRLNAQHGPHMASAISAAMAGAIAPILLTTIGCAVLALFAQGVPSLSWSRLALKWDRLSPLAGAKRLLGKQAWVEFAKTLAKFALVAGVLGLVSWPGMASLDRMVGADAGAVGAGAVAMVRKMVVVAAMMVGALAIGDLVYQRRAWFAKMRMSLQEIRDEHKESEGNPQIKQRIRAIAMQRARGRMMAAVPQASVIITNPTHYAVALSYDHGAMVAPVVVAKGTDKVALRIRQIARDAGVPIVESPPLARALYASVDINHPIKVEQYAAVAEIISYVMKLTRRK